MSWVHLESSCCLRLRPASCNPFSKFAWVEKLLLRNFKWLWDHMMFSSYFHHPAKYFPQKSHMYLYLPLPRSGGGRCVSEFVWLPLYVCMRGRSGVGPEKRGRLAASRVTAPCDVPVIDTQHSAGLLWDPWTWEAAPGSCTGGLKSSVQLMFKPFDLCQEVAFPEFLTSISCSSETMNGSIEDS